MATALLQVDALGKFAALSELDRFFKSIPGVPLRSAPGYNPGAPRRLRASVLGHHQKQVNGLGGVSQNLLIFGYPRPILNAEEGLTSVGKEIPEREMSVAQAVGQVGWPRNELGDHVGVAGREIWFQDQCPVAEISNVLV